MQENCSFVLVMFCDWELKLKCSEDPAVGRMKFEDHKLKDSKQNVCEVCT